MTSLCSVGLFISPVTAQETDSTISSLLIKPRFNGTFQTGPGVGYETSFGSVYGFVPFAQTAGVSTFYSEGRFSLFTDGGGEASNLRVGYRQLLPEGNVVLGSYAGWDVRNSEAEKTFHQLGFGAEALGDKWEARLNAYIPVGETSRTIASSTVDNGFVVSDLSFSGNRLLFSREQTLLKTDVVEAAYSGLDLEGGYQLNKWDGGNLKGYLGLYLLGAEERDTVIGVRGRLQAETENILAGVGLQSDGEFGTNLQFSIGFKLGGNNTRKREETVEESILARLGQSVERQDVIALGRETETKTIIVESATNETAVNPATGQPWNFIHVKDGSNSSGTFEDPYGEVTDAVAEIGAIGTTNDIIYVDSGDRTGMAGFTIPDNVKVLSTGVTQEIELVDAGIIQLPGSGTGTLPLVQSRVTMGNNTTLSGFEVEPTGSAEYIVSARNVSNISIDRNTITETAAANGQAILVQANDGNTIRDISISGNKISAVGGSGIFVESGNGAAINNASITGNTVTTQGDTAYGIALGGRGGASVSDASITNNTVTTADKEAHSIVVFSGDGATVVSNISVANNVATTEGENASGVLVFAFSEGTIQTTSVAGNTIKTGGVTARGIIASSNNSTVRDTSITGNTVATERDGANGIQLVSFGDAALLNNTSILSNTVTTEGEDSSGVQALIENEGVLQGTSIADNVTSVNNRNSRGIFIFNNNSILRDTSITGNTVTNTISNGIYLRSLNSTAMVSNTSISGNTVMTRAGRTALGVVITEGTIEDTSITDNTITATGIYTEGISVFGAESATISSASITGNIVSTAGEQGRGIVLGSDNSIVRDSSISGNTVMTKGDNAHGIDLIGLDYNSVFDDAAIISNTSISGNTVLTKGDNAEGIRVLATEGRAMENTSITNNIISATGEDANGIFVSNQNGSLLDGISVMGNTISTEGEEASGFAVLNIMSEIIDLSLTDNIISQAGEHSFVLSVTNAPLCVVAFRGNTSTNPNAAMMGGDDLVLSTLGGGVIAFVDFDNVMANNTGFDNISGTPIAQPPDCS